MTADPIQAAKECLIELALILKARGHVLTMHDQERADAIDTILAELSRLEEPEDRALIELAWVSAEPDAKPPIYTVMYGPTPFGSYQVTDQRGIWGYQEGCLGWTVRAHFATMRELDGKFSQRFASREEAQAFCNADYRDRLSAARQEGRCSPGEGVRPGDIDWLKDQKEGGHCGEGTLDRRLRADHNDRINRLLAAISTPGEAAGAEPVAWGYQNGGLWEVFSNPGRRDALRDAGVSVQSLYTAPPPAAGLPEEVVRLVKAGKVARYLLAGEFPLHGPQEPETVAILALDAALEPFASRLPAETEEGR